MTTTPNPTAEQAKALAIEIRDTMIRQEWVPAVLGIRAANILDSLAGLLPEGTICEHQNSDYLRMMRERDEARAKISEGSPGEAQIERALDALSRFNQWTDNPRGAMRAALTAAGVVSQEPLVLDPEKVAAVIEPLLDEEAVPRLSTRVTNAFCEAYTEGRLR